MTATISSDATGRTIDAAGISTHYHEAGSGPPVLLLHGSGLESDDILAFSRQIQVQEVEHFKE